MFLYSLLYYKKEEKQNLVFDISDSSDIEGGKVMQNAKEFLLSYSSIKPSKLNFSRLLRTFFQCVQDNDYESLTEEFNKLSLADMILLFDKNRGVILNHAVITSITNKPLYFLINNVHPQLMKEMLREDNYRLVNSLLLSQKQMEPYLKSIGKTEEERKLRVERFYLLLKIEPAGIEDIIRGKFAYMTPSMQEDFQIAYEQFKKTQSIILHNGSPSP